MSKDSLAWVTIILLIVAVVLGVMQNYTAAWIVIAIGVALILFAKLKK